MNTIQNAKAQSDLAVEGHEVISALVTHALIQMERNQNAGSVLAGRIPEEKEYRNPFSICACMHAKSWNAQIKFITVQRNSYCNTVNAMCSMSSHPESPQTTF